MSTTQPEVLAAALTRRAARDLTNQAKRHWRTAARNATQFAAELRRLQDGQAHFEYGFDNFGAFAEHTFDGLTAASAKQFSRMGAVLLTLERHGRIDLEGRDLPGTTALRELSAIHGKYDEAAMLAVYDHATTLRPGRTVVEADVKAAARELLRPQIRPAPALVQAEPEDVPDEDVPDDLEEEDDEDEASPDAVQRFEQLSEYVSDLRLSFGQDPTRVHDLLGLARLELDRIESLASAARREA